MADIFEYLKWRSDVPFSCSSFNEVDNLVLSQLAYTDFDGCIPGINSDETVTLHEIYEQYYKIHTKEEILARTSFIAKAPLLMDDMVDSRRWGDIRFKGYVNYLNGDKNEQMSAVQMWLPDGTCYLAYRGTDDTFIGWKEDLCFAYMNETEGQKHALSYMNDQFCGKDVKLRVGGHSKGGNFAMYASAFCEDSIQNNIIEIWSNDGPGFLHEIVDSEGFQRVRSRITAIVPECSVIGMLMYSLKEKRVVQSSAKGIMQHDANTWQCMGNQFMSTKSRSYDSVLMDKAIRSWLKKLSIEDRKIFIETVFEIIDSSGATCVSELNQSLITNFPKIAKKLGTLPKEKSGNFNKVIIQFAKSYVSQSTESITKIVKDTTSNFMKQWIE